MNKLFIGSFIVSAIFVFSALCTAQTLNNFASGEGGFAIDLPREGVTVEDTPEDEKGLGIGKKYIWKMPDRVFVVAFYLMTEDKPLTPKLRDSILAGFKEGILGSVRKNNNKVTEKPFLNKGNKGVEFRIVYPTGISVVRFYATPTRFFMMQTTLRGMAPEVESAAVKTLSSFRALDAAELKKVKIEEATPEPLPQEPRAKRPTTDAQDENLKGKVQSFFEDIIYLPGTRRERSSEKYFDTIGNLTRDISFSEGYPDLINIWGNIDGKRVSLAAPVEFEHDQRPPSREIIMSLMESPREPPSANQVVIKEDLRYSLSYTYKHDAQGRVIENSLFDNTGTFSDRVVFTYTDSRLDEVHYDSDGETYELISYLLDGRGNIIEKTEFDENDKPSGRSVHRYTFDENGNWTVRRSFEKKMVRGKAILKPVSITYRTINYYH